MKFSEIIQQDKPVLVDFFATWCGPCQVMTPILEQLKTKYGDQATIIKIDVDKNPEIASHLGIQGVPTFILYKNGDQLWRASGARSIGELDQLIQSYL